MLVASHTTSVARATTSTALANDRQLLLLVRGVTDNETVRNERYQRLCSITKEWV
jgi:hypothetical protein